MNCFCGASRIREAKCYWVGCRLEKRLKGYVEDPMGGGKEFKGTRITDDIGTYKL